MCVDPPGITEFTLPACCCDLAPAVAMDRKAVDGTDRQTDGRTPDRYIDPTPHTMPAASINLVAQEDAMVKQNRQQCRISVAVQWFKLNCVLLQDGISLSNTSTA